MAGVEIRVDSRELAKLGLRLDKLRRRAEDTTDLMDEIGSYLVSEVDRRFEQEVGPDGTPWEPSGRAEREGGQTLTDDGELRRTITHEPGNDQVEVGTNKIYAGIHQMGGTIRAKTSKGLRFRVGTGWVTKQQVKIPARPFLGLGPDDYVEIPRIVADYLGEALR